MKTWIIGNWKNNPASLVAATNLTTAIKTSQIQIETGVDTSNIHNQQHVLMPSTLHLSDVKILLKGTDILLGAQDVSKESATTGAYTGDCSAAQLADIGVAWTLVGHSERREYHHEDESILCKKMNNALSEGVGVVFCIGESLEQYENTNTIEVLKKQLSVLSSVKLIANNSDETAINLSDKLSDKLIVAYEPIWAIGTGKVPTVVEVENVHKSINEVITTINPDLADVAIVYGGSVNPDNAQQFAESNWIHGALIGGASLHADKFMDIARIFNETKKEIKSV